MTIKARVRSGCLVVDEPTDLPEGAEVDLLPLDPGDWLDEPQRAALHRAQFGTLCRRRAKPRCPRCQGTARKVSLDVSYRVHVALDLEIAPANAVRLPMKLDAPKPSVRKPDRRDALQLTPSATVHPVFRSSSRMIWRMVSALTRSRDWPRCSRRASLIIV